MRALEFVIILILGAALALVIRDDLKQRASVSALVLVNAAQAKASTAETAGASQGQLRCSQEARSAVNAGRAISRIAAPHQLSGQVGQLTRTMVGATDIRSVVAP